MRAVAFATWLIVVVFSGHTLSQDLDPSQCLAPVEYEACSKNAQEELGECQDLRQEDIRPCVCKAQAAVLNCVGRYCWNKVYGCEYQELAEEMQVHCLPASPENKSPFWPAPPNVPGTCSCDTSSAFTKLLAPSDADTYGRCSDNITAQLAKVSSYEKIMCGCCSTIIGQTITLGSCLGYYFPGFEEGSLQLSLRHGCDAAFDRYKCADFGFDPTFEVNSNSISRWPTPGTETRSNFPGEITSPASGFTYTWSYTWTDYDVKTESSMTHTVTAFSESGTIRSGAVFTGTYPSSSSVLGGGVTPSSPGTITMSPSGTPAAVTSNTATTTTSESCQRHFGILWIGLLMIMGFQIVQAR
ncbi:hypothetical protein IFR05_016053 [Cadophora sp. M221]|nr:hypothetical protein IFR05_016053 [Cadophora sp. M221]